MAMINQSPACMYRNQSTLAVKLFTVKVTVITPVKKMPTAFSTMNRPIEVL